MIGKQILNYKVTSLLGEGGMGNVYLAEHETLGRKVAIKMLHPRFASNAGLKERFKNEASAMAHMQHPSIVSLYDYIESEDGLFLVMEYVEGQELQDYINNVSGPIAEEKAVDIMTQILSAFDYAHGKGIVHRDIKPSNILLTNEGNVKILDFGIAKILGEDNSLTKTGTQMGTVLYMSPEQVRGEKVDHRTDIYSLGVTLFQMITGTAPYKADTAEFTVYNQIVNEPLPAASSLYPAATARMEMIIAKATEKKSADRFNDCGDFMLALSDKDFTHGVVAAAAATVASKTEVKAENNRPKENKAVEKKPAKAKQPKDQKKKKKSGKGILIFIILIGLIGGGYVVVDQVFSGEGSESTEEASMVESGPAWVLSGQLNFRSSKDLSEGSILEVLHFGDEIELLGTAESPVTEGDLELVWQEAEWQGEKGWIAKTIDGQDVVGDEEVKDKMSRLFLNDYDEDAAYGEMKVWAYLELIDWIDQQDYPEGYYIRSDDKEVRKKGLKTILSFKENRIDKDKEAEDEYIVILENGYEFTAVYLKSDGKNSGYVAGACYLPEHIIYLTKRKKGDEVPRAFNMGNIALSEIDETYLGTADVNGTLTGWFGTYDDELEWIGEQYVEAAGALNILENSEGGYYFVSYTEYRNWKNNGELVPQHYWKVQKSWGMQFEAYESNDFTTEMVSDQVTSEFKDGRYITSDRDKAKLFIDTEENTLILYLRDEHQNSVSFYGCIPEYLIVDYLNARDDPYSDADYGC